MTCFNLMLRPTPLAGPGRKIGSRFVCSTSAAGALYLGRESKIISFPQD